MARDDERESWVQTSSEFNQEWSQKENRHVRWRSGLSIDGKAPVEKARHHAPEGARRRPRRWYVWLLFFALIGGGIAYVAIDKTRTKIVTGEIEKAIAGVRKSIKSL